QERTPSREPGRGAAHQRAGRYRRHQRALRGTHFGDPVDGGHGSLPTSEVPSATTIADAMPPSCESERGHPENPQAFAAAATVPDTVSHGRPSGSDTTSQSYQDRPPGAPSALATASFAAKRAASDSGERGLPDAVRRSCSVNKRSASSGVRV